MYGDQERSAMPETLKQAARDGVRVVRVWAFGEGGENASPHWQGENAFRRAPDDWNEKAFIHLDRVLVEAAKNNLRVQLCSRTGGEIRAASASICAGLASPRCR
ncbi:MAG: hypothetical protein WKF84_15520 [Pyrinomonadaceae bacterium]